MEEIIEISETERERRRKISEYRKRVIKEKREKGLKEYFKKKKHLLKRKNNVKKKKKKSVRNVRLRKKNTNVLLVGQKNVAPKKSIKERKKQKRKKFQGLYHHSPIK